MPEDILANCCHTDFVKCLGFAGIVYMNNSKIDIRKIKTIMWKYFILFKGNNTMYKLKTNIIVTSQKNIPEPSPRDLIAIASELKNAIEPINFAGF